MQKDTKFKIYPNKEQQNLILKNTIPYIIENEETADRILSFLEYSNIKDVQKETSSENTIQLLIPKNLYEKASKLIEIALNMESDESISEKEENIDTILAEDNNILYPYQTYDSPNRFTDTKQKPYVKAKDKYEDLKSSIFSFLFVGILVLIIFILDITGIVKLPINRNTIYLMYGCFIAIATFFFVIAFTSARQAKRIKPLIREEEEFTSDVMNWFTEKYTADDIDNDIHKSHPDATEDVKVLYCFDYIKQYITNEYDIPDKSYLDYLCEEIYNKTFDENL